MKLGLFSHSLAVKDLAASISFYEKLGFHIFHDQSKHHYVIMKNEKTIIGLFQGMFENNIMTFNPGWDENATPLESFTDIRDIQRGLKAKGIRLEKEADENGFGPDSFFVTDPDGNAILVDQHV